MRFLNLKGLVEVWKNPLRNESGRELVHKAPYLQVPCDLCLEANPFAVLTHLVLPGTL